MIGNQILARTHPAQLALMGLCGALLLIFLYEIAAPISPYSMPKSAALPVIPEITFQDNATAPSSAAFDDIDARPVFNPSRQAIAAAATSAGGLAALPSDLSLIGVIIEGDTRMALIKSQSAAFASGIKQGDAIEGWTVAEVDPDRVVLQSGPRKQELLLSQNHAAPQSGGPGAGPGSSPGLDVPPPPPPTPGPQGAAPGATPTPMIPTPDISSKPPPDPPSPAPQQ